MSEADRQYFAGAFYVYAAMLGLVSVGLAGGLIFGVVDLLRDRTVRRYRTGKRTNQ